MVSFSRMSQIHILFIDLLGACAFCLELRLLFALRYARMIKTLAMTFFKSKFKMFGVGLVFIPLLMSFASLSYLMYGSEKYYYNSFPKTAGNYTVFVIDFRGHSKQSKSSSIGLNDAAIVLYSLILTLIVMNLFVSILNDFLRAIRKDKDTFRDNEVIDYIIELILSLLPKSKQKVKPGEVLIVVHMCS